MLYLRGQLERNQSGELFGRRGDYDSRHGSADRRDKKNLRGYFKVLVGGDLVTNGKPAPDIFLLAAEKLNIEAEDCYIFEDSFNGIRAAAASGGAAIMIPDTVQPTDDIKRICAAVFNDLNEARRAIEHGDI